MQHEHKKWKVLKMDTTPGIGINARAAVPALDSIILLMVVAEGQLAPLLQLQHSLLEYQ